MAERREYEITLRLVGPFMFASVANARMGVDTAYLRGEDDEPIIPAAQVKGVLREALETLARRTALIKREEIEVLFGVHSKRGGTERNRPERGLVLFDDLKAPKAQDGLRTTRIEIDDETGAVKTGQLQIVELAARFGAPVDFKGRLVIRHKDLAGAARIETAFGAAVRLIPAVGAFKSAGFGEVDAQHCEIRNLSERSLQTLQTHRHASGERVVYDVKFDRPILVDARHLTENVFESAKIIPGAAFKGALAARLDLAGDGPEMDGPVSEALAGLRISHAFPLEGDQEAELPIPASAVFCRDGGKLRFGDAICAEFGDAPMFDAGGDLIAADFVQSAKDEDKEAWRNIFETPELDVPMLPRMHVGMNEDTEGQRIALDKRAHVAEDEKLFSSVRMPVSKRKWRLTVDAGKIGDKTLAGRLLAVLEDGLDDVGKTSATAALTRRGEKEDASTPQDAQETTVMLVTPAVLFDGKELASRPRWIDGKSPLMDFYRSYFSKHLEVELVNFFARLELAGGHVAIRRQSYRDVYYPFVLTAPGAVFRLRKGGAGWAKLDDALRFGLPAADLDGKQANWRTCPYVPENGYGEIRPHALNNSRLSKLSFVQGL